MEPIPSLTFSFSQTSLGLRVRVEDTGKSKVALDGIFSNLRSISGNLKDVLELMAEYMRGSFADNFDAQGRPRWDPLSPAYLAYRQAEGLGDTILDITGELREEVTSESGPGHVEEIIEAGKTTTLIIGGSSLKFITHQQGASGSRGPVFASPGKKLRWYGSHGEVFFADSVGPADFEIPARPMIVVSGADRDELIQIFRVWAHEKLGV